MHGTSLNNGATVLSDSHVFIYSGERGDRAHSNTAVAVYVTMSQPNVAVHYFNARTLVVKDTSVINRAGRFKCTNARWRMTHMPTRTQYMHVRALCSLRGSTHQNRAGATCDV